MTQSWQRDTHLKNWKVKQPPPPQTIALSAEARLIDTSTFLAATLQCWLRNILSTDSIIVRAKKDRSAMLHQHSNTSTDAECFYSLISNLASFTDLEQPLLGTCCRLQEEYSNQGFAHSWAALFPTALTVSLQTASPCHPCVCEILSVLMCWFVWGFLQHCLLLGAFLVLKIIDASMKSSAGGCWQRLQKGGSAGQIYTSWRTDPGGMNRHRVLHLICLVHSCSFFYIESPQGLISWTQLGSSSSLPAGGGGHGPLTPI